MTSDAQAGTGTFLDKRVATDLRVATYNIYNDSVLTGSRRNKFSRVAAALRPDIWAFQEFYNTNVIDIRALLNEVQPAAPGRSWSLFKYGEHVIASQFAIGSNAFDTSPGGYRPIAMAKLDLPDADFATDLYLMNAHYRCCAGNDPARQQQSDALVNWMRDARTPGGSINLAPGTAMMVMGDFNIVDSQQPLATLLDGNIRNNTTYGSDAPPDWDGSDNKLVDAYQNANSGGEQWTWRSDGSGFEPTRLDYITYTDSVVTLRHSFALNTTTMSAAERSTAGLLAGDAMLNESTGNYDHLPVIADFAGPLPGDLDGDQDRDARDIDLLSRTADGVTTGANWRADVARDGVIKSIADSAASDLDRLVRGLLNTEYGDATLNQRVNFADLVMLAQHYNTSGAGVGWATGDFTGDAIVNFGDLVVLAQHYNFNGDPTGAAPLALPETIAADWALVQTMVPEPASIIVAAASFACVAGRRRR